jgi:hypothetical protein
MSGQFLASAEENRGRCGIGVRHLGDLSPPITTHTKRVALVTVPLNLAPLGNVEKADTKQRVWRRPYIRGWDRGVGSGSDYVRLLLGQEIFNLEMD